MYNGLHFIEYNSHSIHLPFLSTHFNDYFYTHIFVYLSPQSDFKSLSSAVPIGTHIPTHGDY